MVQTVWERKILEEAIPATAEALCRACELASEVQWRFDLSEVVFRERLSQTDREVHLSSLWVLGCAESEYILYGTSDYPCVPGGLAARVDAGGVVLEAVTLEGLLRACRGKQLLGTDVYDVCFLLAHDLLIS
jgi:hypothetical protein